MLVSGESRKDVMRHFFNRAIMIDCQRATTPSAVVFLLVGEIAERFRIICPMQDYLEGLRSPTHP